MHPTPYHNSDDDAANEDDTGQSSYKNVIKEFFIEFNPNNVCLKLKLFDRDS